MQNNNKTTTQQAIQWLLSRGISDRVLANNKIRWDDKLKRIVIPILNKDGNFVFNKYRRDPFSDNGPKYTYDKGSTSSLYNVHQEDRTRPLIICEGELDCLLLQSYGISAVSSTGGAGTFKKEWADFLGKPDGMYVCLDSDDAGVRGMIRIAQMIPGIKWIILPQGRGKDVTEFINRNGIDEFRLLVDSAVAYEIPDDEKERDLKRVANEIVELQRSDYSPHLEIIREFLKSKYELRTKQKSRKVVVASNAELEEIKKIPLINFIKFDRHGFAECKWHKEKTPSLHYIEKDNKAYCFGCGKPYDVIDAVMQIENVDFRTALNKLRS